MEVMEQLWWAPSINPAHPQGQLCCWEERGNK